MIAKLIIQDIVASLIGVLFVITGFLYLDLFKKFIIKLFPDIRERKAINREILIFFISLIALICSIIILINLL